jgi:transcriptional regulator with GAF, ATPase, and Fis domain
VSRPVVLWFDPEVTGTARAGITHALAAAGIEPAPQGTSGFVGVFFAAVGDQVLDAVSRLAAGAEDRLVAVAATGADVDDRDAWRLVAAGAADVFCWRHSDTPAEEIAARLERWVEIDAQLESDRVGVTLVGRCAAWRRALRDVVEVARYSRSDVLLTGESGTGKELAAHLIHDLDPRPDKGPFVTLDCTTVVPSLAGSEFFGHERGAFTGAVATREGAFSLADGGTLFLDEVGELPPALQAELLRVVQEGAYKRVGGNKWHRTHFRLISATHRDLAQEAAADRFRHDFLYRIAPWRCRLPPMRERPDDVLVLARHFLQRLDGHAPPPLDPVVERHLSRRDFPGNVRELKHLVEQMARTHVGPGPITLGDLPDAERPSNPSPERWDDGDFAASIERALREGAGLKEIGDAATDVAVDVALHEAGGSVRAASERLGVTPRALQLRAARRRMTLVGATAESGRHEVRFAGRAVEAKDHSLAPPAAPA